MRSEQEKKSANSKLSYYSRREFGPRRLLTQELLSVNTMAQN
jgi:hypothetical protein